MTAHIHVQLTDPTAIKVETRTGSDYSRTPLFITVTSDETAVCFSSDGKPESLAALADVFATALAAVQDHPDYRPHVEAVS